MQAQLSTATSTLLGTAFLAFALPDSAAAQNTAIWPNYLGPNFNNTAEVGEIDFSKWNEKAPEVLWRVEVGEGFGGAAIAGNDVAIFDRQPGEDILMVLDLATGEERYSESYESRGRLQFPGSRTVPIIDEERIYTFGGFGHVTGWDRASGELIWQVDCRNDLNGELPMFGFSSNLLLVDDKVIVTALGDELGLVALDSESGDPVWQTEPIKFSHVTPVFMNLLGKDQILMISVPGEGSGNSPSPSLLWSFDPETGDTLWMHEITLSSFPIPSPMKISDDHIFLTTGYVGGSVLFKLQPKAGDVLDFELEEVFRNPRGSQVHQPIIFEDHVYFMACENANQAGSRRKQGGLMCMTMDGKEVWRTGDEPYIGLGNMLRVGNMLLVQDGDDGTLRVVRATPEKYDLVAELGALTSRGRNQLWGPMAIAQGRLIMRGQNEILCLKL